METKNIIGIDIGGVIIDRDNDLTDTSFFGGNFLQTTAVPHAFDAIARLVDNGFDVYLVSKCGAQIQEKSKLWLAHHRFFEQTGVPQDNIRFCRTREGKVPICQNLGVTHFVDDRLEILSYLEPHVRQLFLLNATEKEVSRYRDVLPLVQHVSSWLDIVESLTGNTLLVEAR